ncbi:hypothetical protein [Sphingomonas aracearum]|uniref:HEPN domain-containing protein n=1 Tax=Sphingomonas aracearum TaxID=2283317 RepID=A0A369VSQ4_9SPHN|nr:hypothetical protein [Sphingomonas aracearum]RDE04705.1 hypothetical protein DVW87_14045 [Sphingomonas aracearum]
MQQDLQLRAAAREIYDTFHTAADAGLRFDQAERFRTDSYHQAVGAAQGARRALAASGDQLPLFASR